MSDFTQRILSEEQVVKAQEMLQARNLSMQDGTMQRALTKDQTTEAQAQLNTRNIRYSPAVFNYRAPALPKTEEDVYSLANKEIPLPAQNASQDEIDKFNKDSQAKIKAQNIISFTAFNLEANPELYKKEYGNFEQWYLKRYSSSDPEEVKKQAFNEFITFKYNQALIEHGTLPQDIMTDERFIRYVTPEGYANLKQTYDLFKRSLGLDRSNWSRSWELGKRQRRLNQKLVRGEISYDDYAQENYKDLLMLSSVDDSATVSAISSMLSQMSSSVFDNKRYMVLGAILGIPLSFLTRGAINPGGTALALPMATDTAEQTQAQIVADVMAERKRKGLSTSTKDIENAKAESVGQAYSVATIDMVADMATAVVLSKGFKLTKACLKATNKVLAKSNNRIVSKAVEKINSSTLGKEAVAESVKTEAKTVEPNYLKEIGKFTAKMIGVGAGNTAMQIGTEVLQDSISTATANSILGLSEEESDERLYETIKNTTAETWLPLTILTAVGLAPRTIKGLYRIHNAKGNLVKNQEEATAAVYGKDTIDPESPEAQTALFDTVANNQEVNLGSRYLSYDDVKSVLNALGTDDPSVLGETLARQIQDAKNNEDTFRTFNIPLSELNKLEENTRLHIFDNSADSIGAETPAESRMSIDEQEQEHLRQEIQKQREELDTREQELNEIRQDIDRRLNGVVNVKKVGIDQSRAFGYVYSSFIGSMSKITGVAPKHLHELLAPNLRLQETTFDSTNKGQTKDSTQTAGAYTSEDNTITLSPKADFSTALHEFGHFFFVSFVKLSQSEDVPVKQREFINSFLKDFKNWALLPDDANLLDLSNQQVAQAHEKFVASFLISIIVGSLDARTNKLFKPFKKFLASTQNVVLYNGLKSKAQRTEEIKQKGMYSDAGYVAEHYRQTVDPMEFNFAFNPDMLDLVQTMFSSEVEKVKVEASYPSDSIFDGVINSPLLTEETKAELRQVTREVREESAKAVERLKHEQLGVFIAGGMLDPVLKEIKKFSKNVLSEAEVERFNKFFGKFTESRKRIKARAKSIQNQLENSEQALVYNLFQKQKVNINSIPHELYYYGKRLRQAGMGGERGKSDAVLIDASDLPSILSTFFPEMGENLTLKQCLVFLSNKPDYEQQALARAVMEEVQTIQHLNNESPITQRCEQLAMNRRILLGNKERKVLKELKGSQEDIVRENLLLKKVAKENVGNTRWRDIDLRKIILRCSINRRKAMDALSKGTEHVAEAYNQLKNERFNQERLINMKERSEIIAKKWKLYHKLCKRSDKELTKLGYDLDAINLIRAVLVNVRVGRYVDNKGQVISYDNIANFGQRDPNIEPLSSLAVVYPAFAEFVRADLNALNNSPFNRDYMNSSINDIEYVQARVDQLISLAREARSAVVNGERVSREQQYNACLSSLNKHKDKLIDTSGTEGHEAGTPKTPVKNTLYKSILEYFGISRRMENFCADVDQQLYGNWFKNVFKPIMDGYTQARLADIEIKKRQTEALKKIEKFEATPIIEEGPEALLLKGNDGKTLKAEWGTNRYKGSTTIHLMGVLMSMGTNYEHFLKNWMSDTYGDLGAKDIAFRKWLERMIKQGHITKGMLECTQELSQINRDVALKANKTSLKLRGEKFKELPSKKWHTSLGDFEIGYAPLMLNEGDVRKGVHGNMDLSDPTQSLSVGNVLANNTQSFHLDRVNAEYRHSLDFARILSATTQVSNYTYMQPAVVQVYKLFNLKNADGHTLREYLERKYPGQYERIDRWLMANAMMKDHKQFKHLDRLLSMSVSAVGTATMAGNLNNAVQGISQIFTDLTVASPSKVITSLARVAMSYKSMRHQMMEESDYMRLRMTEANNGISIVAGKVLIDAKKVDSFSGRTKAHMDNFNQWSKEHAYFMQKWVTDFCDVVAYDAVKRGEMDKMLGEQAKISTDITEGEIKKIEKEAIVKAESAVRLVNASFDLPSVSEGERGNAIQKMFLQFGSYFFTMAQLNRTKIIEDCHREGVTNVNKVFMCAYHISATMIVPSIVAYAINEAFTDQVGDDEDSQSDYWWGMALSPFKMYLSSFPYIGKSLNTVVDEIQGHHFYNSTMMDNPLMTFTATNYRAFKNIIDTFFNEDSSDLKGKDLRAVVNLIAIATKNPMLTMLSRPVGYTFDVYMKNVIPAGPADFARGLVTGIASADSKRNN